MSRRKAATKKERLPDPVFNSEIITRLINFIMHDGKKAVASNIVYGALWRVLEVKGQAKKQENTKNEVVWSAENSKHALELFEKALVAVKPAVEVRSKRVGGSTYQVPVEVRDDRKEALGLQLLVKAARGRKEKTMKLRLANEILNIFEGKGEALKMLATIHSMAKANKAFSHYRW